ncbi:MAG: hypothetical protein QNJ14_11960 [Woeseiaceae bacterium]|nr:hypothetical protein [Woeseiaceae bacterium]
MWLPTPLYEALPFLYVSVGSLLIAGVAYIGFDVRSASFYFSLGVACVLFGLLLYYIRYVHRTSGKGNNSDSVPD